MIKEYTRKQFLSDKVIFDKCAQIYFNKYPQEEDFSYDNVDGIIFYVLFEKEDVIGYAFYQDVHYMSLIHINLNKEYIYTDKHIKFLNYIICSTKNNIPIYMHSSIYKEYKFYLKNGFKLFKEFDFGFYNIDGKDVMKWSLYLNYNHRLHKLKYILK